MIPQPPPRIDWYAVADGLALVISWLLILTTLLVFGIRIWMLQP
jgi:hypothetical protein